MRLWYAVALLALLSEPALSEPAPAAAPPSKLTAPSSLPPPSTAAGPPNNSTAASPPSSVTPSGSAADAPTTAQPADVHVSLVEMVHVVNYLRVGGTRAEADALADQLTRSVAPQIHTGQGSK